MNETYLGYSTNQQIRYKATSGGIGTSLLKYLFEHKLISSSISFEYNSESLQYYPTIIYNYNDYKISGSIYHEIDLVNFIRQNIKQIKGDFACFALPCQSKAIKTIIEKNGHHCYIIGLTCSSQQSIQATSFLLTKLHLKRSEIAHIQYRGNGWPSGIQISLKNNQVVFVPNNNSIWTRIFHSRIFIQNRCFKCQDTLNKNSDITLADPWLSNIMKVDTIGQTLIHCNTEKGKQILLQAFSSSYIYISEFNKEFLILSQQSTLKRKESYKKHKKLTTLFRKIIHSPIYIFLIEKIPYIFNFHCL